MLGLGVPSRLAVVRRSCLRSIRRGCSRRSLLLRFSTGPESAEGAVEEFRGVCERYAYLHEEVEDGLWGHAEPVRMNWMALTAPRMMRT